MGYISPDAYEHVAVKFFVGLLKYADRKRFEVFFYALNKKSDETTKIVKNAVEHFVNVSGDDYKTIAAKIFADGIDILYERSRFLCHGFRRDERSLGRSFTVRDPYCHRLEHIILGHGKL